MRSIRGICGFVHIKRLKAGSVCGIIKISTNRVFTNKCLTKLIQGYGDCLPKSVRGAIDYAVRERLCAGLVNTLCVSDCARGW